MIFLSSGVARQRRKARDDLIAWLLYWFSNLRYYKHNISDVSYINDNFKLWTSFLAPIPRRKMKFSTNFAAMLCLVGRIKSSLKCYPSLELRDITHTQAHLFTGRISKLDLHSLQSYGCVRITSWITLVGSMNFICKFSCQLHNVAFNRLESHTPFLGPISLLAMFNLSFMSFNIFTKANAVISKELYFRLYVCSYVSYVRGEKQGAKNSALWDILYNRGPIWFINH